MKEFIYELLFNHLQLTLKGLFASLVESTLVPSGTWRFSTMESGDLFCSAGWNEDAGRIVCAQLGYDPSSSYFTINPSKRYIGGSMHMQLT